MGCLASKAKKTIVDRELQKKHLIEKCIKEENDIDSPGNGGYGRIVDGEIKCWMNNLPDGQKYAQ